MIMTAQVKHPAKPSPAFITTAPNSVEGWYSLSFTVPSEVKVGPRKGTCHFLTALADKIVLDNFWIVLVALLASRVMAKDDTDHATQPRL